MERVDNNRGITLLVDYAHTGDALENVLSTLKELATGRIITVFGCGGDRDPGKRPIMGRIAARAERPGDCHLRQSAHRGSVEPSWHRSGTASPRWASANMPLRNSTSDFGEKGFVMLENRREAIRLAVRLARPGDIVLLAGKGHEDYQIIGKTKHHFDDREEAAAAFAELDSLNVHHQRHSRRHRWTDHRYGEREVIRCLHRFAQRYSRDSCSYRSGGCSFDGHDFLSAVAEQGSHLHPG